MVQNCVLSRDGVAIGTMRTTVTAKKYTDISFYRWKPNTIPDPNCVQKVYVLSNHNCKLDA